MVTVLHLNCENLLGINLYMHKFGIYGRQDVAEFLLRLWEKCNFLQSVLACKITEVFSCSECYETQNPITTHSPIISLFIPDFYIKKTLNLQEIINYNLDNLLLVDINYSFVEIDQHTKNCTSTIYNKSTTVKIIGSFITVQLRFKESQKIVNSEKLKIKSIPQDKIKINGKEYRVRSVIFDIEHVDNPQEYIAYIRKKRNSWYSIKYNS